MEIRVFGSSSAGNCYHITDGTTGLLLDCGFPYREIQQHMDFRMSKLAGVLVTHEHQDHCKAVKDFLYAACIDCYMSRGTAAKLKLNHHRLNLVKAGEKFRIGTWTVLPFDITHDAEEPLGFLLASGEEKLLYLTDTAYCRYRFKGLTHVLVEANYSTDILDANVAAGVLPAELRNRLRRSHMSLEVCKEFLRANDLSRVQEIMLIHLSGGNSDAARFKREIAALTGRIVTIAG